MLIITGILEIVFLILAIKASAGGNVGQTVLFCALMICEEISFQHQQNREVTAHD